MDARVQCIYIGTYSEPSLLTSTYDLLLSEVRIQLGYGTLPGLEAQRFCIYQLTDKGKCVQPGELTM